MEAPIMCVSCPLGIRVFDHCRMSMRPQGVIWNSEATPGPDCPFVLLAAMSKTINEATANLMRAWDGNLTFVDLQQMTAVIADQFAAKDAEIEKLRAGYIVLTGTDETESLQTCIYCGEDCPVDEVLAHDPDCILYAALNGGEVNR